MYKRLSSLVSTLLLAGCAGAAQVPAAAGTSASGAAVCPKEVPAGTRCFSGQDNEGAYYWIAIPQGWEPKTGALVMHAHGGPSDTGPAKPGRSLEDLQRWAVTVKAGYAWAGSTYRRGGYGVTMAAEDTERLRRLFVEKFGQPRRTLLHGQSYGGGVASKAAELYAKVDGRPGPYDELLITSGVLGGGTRAYDFRLDLRVVYQYVCRNHPREEEPQYPLWTGLPKDSKLTRAELANRVDECTGVRKPADQRSPQQKANLADIVNVVRIAESSLIGHLNWGTWLFRDLTQLRLGGRNPFSNVGAAYKGSRNDEALNAGVLRYAADPTAVADLERDSAPNGEVVIPTLSLHAINDPVAFVELDSLYREIRQGAGTSDLLVQTFSDESEHSFLAEPQYPALFTALLNWIDKGEKPTPERIAELCKGYQAAYGQTCRFRADYHPGPLESRVTARPRAEGKSGLE